MEKFAIKKTERFFAQQKNLILPCIELMYLWNSFKILRKQFTLADGVYKLVEKSLIDVNSKLETSRFDVDNRALILLLKGACLRQMKSPLQALRYVLKMCPVVIYFYLNLQHYVEVVKNGNILGFSP